MKENEFLFTKVKYKFLFLRQKEGLLDHKSNSNFYVCYDSTNCNIFIDARFMYM